MKIVQMTFKKTWNLGDYNSESLEVVAGVEETDNPSKVCKELIAFTKLKGETEITSTAGEVKVTETKAEDEPKTKKAKAETKEKVSTETTKQEAQNGEEKSEKSSEKSSEKTSSQKSEKVKQGKTSPYNPDDSISKKLVGEFLDKAVPDWRNNVKHYKEVSHSLKGTPFQDSEGMVLEEFKTSFLEKSKELKG